MSQVVTNESWFQRIGHSIKGILLGGLLCIAALPVLAWNEGRAVHTTRALTEGAASFVETSPEQVNPELEGRFVHLQGEASTDEILHDADFGIGVNAIHLERRVEMYQWKERQDAHTEREFGGDTTTTTTYRYTREWSPKVIPSHQFHEPKGHENPTDMPFFSRTLSAREVKLGAFQIPSKMVPRIKKRTPVEIQIDCVAPELQRQLRSDGEHGVIWSRWGADGDQPRIGDVRIRFFATMSPVPATVMAQQAGPTLRPFRTANGRTLELLALGHQSPETMIQQARESNTVLTWLLRAAGAAMMCFGLQLVLAPLAVLSDVVPPLGRVVGAGVGLVAVLVGSTLSLVTISLAWLFYRPLIGVPLLLAAAGLSAVLLRRLRHAPTRADAEPWDQPPAVATPLAVPRSSDEVPAPMAEETAAN